MSTISKNQNKDYALMQSIMILAPFLTSIISIGLGNEDNNLMIVTLFILIIYIYSLLKYKKKYMNISLMLLIILVLLIYTTSYLIYNEVMDISIVDIVFYFILAIIVMFKQVDSEILLKYMIIISLLGIPISKDLFMKSNTSLLYDTISMGLSYALIPAIIASYLHFMYYRKKSNILIKIGYIVNLYYLYKVVTMGYRGPVMTLMFPILFTILIKFDKDGKNISKFTIKHVIFIGIMVIILCITLVNFKEIIDIIYNMLNKLNINIPFITKTHYLASQNDISHGRSVIMIESIKHFFESPIWGNGIGVFGEKVKIPDIYYPHNFILQLLYDGGILLCLPVLYLLINGLKKGIKSNLDEGYPTIVLLTCISLPRLMVSANIWRLQAFWMLIAFLVINYGNGLIHKKYRVLNEI